MEKSKKMQTLIYFRALATIFIVICHLAHLFSSQLILFSAHFFDVGVEMFLLMSGFIYGQRERSIKITGNSVNAKSSIKWFLRKMRKLLIPMYVVLLVLLIGHIFLGNEIVVKDYIVYIFNFQGLLEWYVQGAQHLWYLSVAMVCYFITPLLCKYKEKIDSCKFAVIGGGYCGSIADTGCV